MSSALFLAHTERASDEGVFKSQIIDADGSGGGLSCLSVPEDYSLRTSRTKTSTDHVSVDLIKQYAPGTSPLCPKNVYFAVTQYA